MRDEQRVATRAPVERPHEARRERDGSEALPEVLLGGRLGERAEGKLHVRVRVLQDRLDVRLVAVHGQHFEDTLHRGQRLGPYYRLAYRKNGQQRSIYLGNCLGLVERVRDALEDIQGRMRESRVISRLIQRAKEGLAACKERLRRQLATLGIKMQGWEMRGVREAYARDFRPIVSPLVDNPAIPPPAPMFAVNMQPGLRAWLWQAINERAMANEAELRAQGVL